MHTRSMATSFVSLAFVACAAGPPSGLVALGERCSPTQACGPELVCFRTVCVPDTEAPLPPPPRAPPEPAPVVPYPTLARAPIREVYATDAEVRTVLVAGEGLLVVEPTRVVRLDAEGVPVAVFEPGDEVLAVALEDQRLLVAGPEVLTVLTPELVSTATLASPASGPCSSLVVLSGDRVICRRGTESGTFLTMDVQTGAVLAESMGDDLGLVSARRVPGEDSFVASFARDSSLLYFFELDAEQRVVQVNGLGAQTGSAMAANEFTFLGDPATHVSMMDAQLLRIRGPDCSVDSSVPPVARTCFDRDARLGGIWGRSRYENVGQDGPDGALVLLKDESLPRFGGGVCTADLPCLLAQLDVQRRAIRQVHYIFAPIIEVVALLSQPSLRRAVLVERYQTATLVPEMRTAIHVVPLTGP